MAVPVEPGSNTQGNLGGINIAGVDGNAGQEEHQILNRNGSGAAGQRG